MVIRTALLSLTVFGFTTASIFCMQPGGGQPPEKRRKTEAEGKQEVVDEQAGSTSSSSSAAALAEIRRIREERYKKHKEELDSKKREESEQQERARQEKQKEELAALKQEQDQFDALDDLMTLLAPQIEDLGIAQTFEEICSLLEGIAGSLGESNLDFAVLKDSRNEVLATKVADLFVLLQSIVAKIEANPIAQRACLKLESINAVLNIICCIVGFEGGIEVKIVGMYTEEDEAIAEFEREVLEQEATVGDAELARLLQEEQTAEQDVQLARLLGNDFTNPQTDGDAELARRLGLEDQL